jgi:hypothetical protein
MRLLSCRKGQSLVEWLIVAVLIVAMLGGTLIGLYLALQDKLEAIRDAL